MLYSIDDSMFFLGCLANNPQLAINNKYKISKNDFILPNCNNEHPSRFHYLMYVAIYNLVAQGAKEIDSIIVDTYLQNHPERYEECKKFDFKSFITSIKNLTSSNNVDYYYENIRKYAMLRQYKDVGFNIADIYDETKNLTEQNENLQKLTLSDIDSHFESKRLKIKQEYIQYENIENYKIGDDFEDTLEQLDETPLTGCSFQSLIMNGIHRGLMGFIIRSGGSGSGKTTLAVADICKSSATHIYDYKVGKFIKNKSRVGASLFINTEMDLRTELDPMFAAYISGVPRSHIIDGRYVGNEKERVQIANKIMKKSEIFAVDDPEFTVTTLSNTIEEYVMKYNVKVVCFDYVCNNGYVGNELAKQADIKQREDMILLTLTDRIKQLQRKYGVHILSGTQLNGKELELESPDERCFAGGKSQVRKVDGAMIMRDITKKELTSIEPYLPQIQQGKKPNMVTHIIKGRASRYPKYIKVFQTLDLGTGRVEDLFCTTKDYMPIKVEPLIIEY